MLGPGTIQVGQTARSTVWPRLDAPALACAILLTFAFAVGLVHFTDPDYWWHLETGRYIIEHRSVPTEDPFSFTAPGRHWVTHEWLSEVLIYGMQWAGGYAANTVLFSGLVVATLYVGFRTAVAMGLSRWVAVGLLLWTAVMILPYVTVRPLVFTWLFFAIFLYVLTTHTPGRRLIWFLPVLVLLWANLHAGYVIGLAQLGAFVIATGARRLILHEDCDVKLPVLVTLASFTVTVVNPNTIDLLLYPFLYLKPGNSISALITEWQSPDFHSPLHMGLAVALLALVCTGVFSRERLFLTLITVGCIYLALQSSRHQPLFALTFLVVMAAVLPQRYAWARPQWQPSSTSGHSLVNWALLGVVVLLIAAFVGGRPDLQLGVGAQTDADVKYPRHGAQFISTNYPEGRVFNEFHWGGYLIHALPSQGVFVDGRPDMYGDAFMHEYINIVTFRDGWQDILAKYDVDLMMIEAKTSLAEQIESTPEWRVVFRGPIEVIFARTGSSVR